VLARVVFVDPLTPAHEREEAIHQTPQVLMDGVRQALFALVAHRRMPAAPGKLGVVGERFQRCNFAQITRSWRRSPYEQAGERGLATAIQRLGV